MMSSSRRRPTRVRATSLNSTYSNIPWAIIFAPLILLIIALVSINTATGWSVVQNLKVAQTYRSTTCHVLNSSIVLRYCPETTCSWCTAIHISNASICSALDNEWNGILVSELAPQPPLSTWCNNRYSCCSKSCNSRNVNCVCILDVSDLQCTWTATRCALDQLIIEYNDHVVTHYQQDFGTDLVNANSSFPVSSTFACYYDKHNPEVVVTSLNYNWAIIIVNLVLIILTILNCIPFTHMILRKCFIGSYQMMAWEFFWWCSCFFPLVILLPIIYTWDLSFLVSEILLYFAFIFMALGMLPLILLKCKDWRTRSLSLCIYIILIFSPLGIIFPFLLTLLPSYPEICLLLIFPIFTFLFLVFGPTLPSPHLSPQRRLRMLQRHPSSLRRYTFHQYPPQQQEYRFPNIPDTHPTAPQEIEMEPKQQEHTQEEGKQTSVYKQDDLCEICCNQPKTHMLSPCNHYGFCESCAKNFQLKGCPVCRTVVTKIVHVYTM